jgi:hypothetical protein
VRIDLDQQIHVARRPGLAAGRRADSARRVTPRPRMSSAWARSRAITRSRSAAWPGDPVLAGLDMALTW